MFDKLFDLIYNAWEELWFLRIIKQNELGLRLRFGKLHKRLNPGVVLKLPLGIDTVLIQYVGDDTIQLSAQPLTTKDNKSVSISGNILYHITDVEPFLLNASVPTVTISDIASAEIAKLILSHDWNEIVDGLEKMSNKISINVRRECKRWGVHVEYVQIVSISQSRSFNIMKYGESHL